MKRRCHSQARPEIQNCEEMNQIELLMRSAIHASGARPLLEGRRKSRIGCCVLEAQPGLEPGYETVPRPCVAIPPPGHVETIGT